MDMQKRNALLRKVGDVNHKQNGLVLVTLEEFFEGNDDPGSIWPNLDNEPIPEEVFKVLKAIRNREEVADVRILVTQFDGADDEWPFSDTVFVITSSTKEEVQSWFGNDYAPDEVEYDDFFRAQKIPVPFGMHPVSAWWD